MLAIIIVIRLIIVIMIIIVAGPVQGEQEFVLVNVGIFYVPYVLFSLDLLFV